MANKAHHYPQGTSRQEKVLALMAGVRAFSLENSDKGGWRLLPNLSDEVLRELLGVGRTLNSCTFGIGKRLEDLANGKSTVCDSKVVVHPDGSMSKTEKVDPVQEILKQASELAELSKSKSTEPEVVDPVVNAAPVEPTPGEPVEPSPSIFDAVKFEDEAVVDISKKSKKSRH
jgi:hypothetical protein